MRLPHFKQETPRGFESTRLIITLADPRNSGEPMFEDDQPDYYDPEVLDDDQVGRDQEGEETDNVVASGDPSAAANAGKSSEKSHRDKKIPDDQRTTTPYMTKYEKARILGTRALQIRWGLSKFGELWWEASVCLLTRRE